VKKFICVTLDVAKGLAIAAITSALLVSGAHAAAVDLGLWSDESYPAVSGFGAGVWTVSGDGLSVNQSVNGQPTLFVSDFVVAGLAIEGMVTVNSADDDDLIGFALGFIPGDADPGNNTADYLLVDWKQGTQGFNFGSPSCTSGSTSSAGLAVSRVTGIPTADEFWGHFDEDNLTCSPAGEGLEELQRATNLGATGWADNTDYTFRFEFTATSLVVFVNGVEELNITGTFNDGSLAFYNFSQANVTYSAFETQPLLSKALTSGPDRDGALWYEDFSDVSDLTLNGNAAQAGSALRLTPAIQGQVGSAFTSNSLTLGPGGSFNTHFSFQITDSGGGGADGLAFVVHNAAAADTAIGGAGGNMGYSGITPSLAVEFDTWNNGGGLGDPDGNHVGTGINGAVGSGVAVPLAGPPLDGGTVFYAWVDYDGVADVLEVRVNSANVRPATPTLSQGGIGLAANLGGTSAYVGFTSGTGAAFGNHDILSWYFGTTAAEYIDLVVPINIEIPTEYDFTITYDDSGSTPVVIDDRVPAEWDVTHIEFDGTGLPVGCGDDADFSGDYGDVNVFRGGKSGKNCNSDTGLLWTPVGEDNTLNVQTMARCHNNKNNNFCRPTSCGALYLNYGAVAYETDGDGELVLDVEGNPIVVLGPTDPICLAAVDDVDGDGTFTWDGSGDEDGDNLSDYEEACAIGTDPCLLDTDGDGINDDVDECPLEGPADPGLGEILEPNGCIRQSQCSDGIDNDGDTFIDYVYDAGCDDILDDIEEGACLDAFDCSDISSVLVECGNGGDCACFQNVDGPSVCVDATTPCAGLVGCGTGADCAANEACVPASCCGVQVCINTTICNAPQAFGESLNFLFEGLGPTLGSQ